MNGVSTNGYFSKSLFRNGTRDKYDNDKFEDYIALMMEAGSTSETSVYSYETTRRNVPEGCHRHARSSENLNSHHV